MTLKTEVATSIRSLVCDHGRLSVATSEPALPVKNQLLVDVMALGLCRTDLYAIAGEIETASQRFIPGHEFSGVVSSRGPDVVSLEVGDRVVVNPVVPCGNCHDCHLSNFHLCAQAKLLGVDMDGACAEKIMVTEAMTYPIANELSFMEASFAEPVAATLAIIKANISREQSGLIIGDSRIAELARRVLEAHQFDNVQLLDLPQSQATDSAQFDFVIEASATSEVLDEMVRLVRPRGTLVLKSRQHRPMEIRLRHIIPKEPSINVVNYGRFDHALDLLASRKVVVDDLIGDQFALDDYQAALDKAHDHESKKVFLLPGS